MIKQIVPALLCCVGLWGAPIGAALAAVDVNQADEAALTSVKGIGPAMAHRIVEERGKQGAFKDATDLAHRVKGLGPRSVARLQDEGLTIGKGSTSAPARKDAGTAAAAKGDKAAKWDKADKADKAGKSVH